MEGTKVIKGQLDFGPSTEIRLKAPIKGIPVKEDGKVVGHMDVDTSGHFTVKLDSEK